MPKSDQLKPAELRRIPPALSTAVVRRADWSFCAMEHSRIGAIEFDAPGAAFHHVALPLERTPLRFGLHMDGRPQLGRNAPDMVTMIEAGAGGMARWDDIFESACFYFTDDALAEALGMEGGVVDHAVRTRVELHAPRLVRLLHALHSDAVAGQPHGSLVGDALFVTLASLLVKRGDHAALPRHGGGEICRVRRALEYIHANLTDRIDIAAIARAAATSPFYLNHAFRTAVGCSIWQYVLRERAKYGLVLMRETGASLTEIALSAGFETYASFISATRQAFGETPTRLRRDLSSAAAKPERPLSRPALTTRNDR